MIYLFFCVFMASDSPEALWSQANQAYQDGRYEDALTLYEDLLLSGVDNGKLHYNLGNAYQKTGHLGRAILHYSRAQKLLPGDPDVKANLEIANQMRVDPQIDEENEEFTQSLQTLSWRIGYRSIFFLALAFLCVAGLASLILVLRPATGKWLGYVLVVGGVLGLLFMGGAFLQHNQMTRKDFAVVVTRQVDVLSGPSTKESVSFTIHEGIRCKILDRTEGWYRIRLANGFNGWLPRQAVEII